MEAKPLISTPTLRLLSWENYCHGFCDMLCGDHLSRFFGLPKASLPKRIRIHGFAKRAKGRHRIRLRRRRRKYYTEVCWTTHASARPTRIFPYGMDNWLLKKSPLGPQLQAGKTITLWLQLEVVEE